MVATFTLNMEGALLMAAVPSTPTPTPTPTPTSTATPELDVLNFALNLEYLEAHPGFLLENPQLFEALALPSKKPDGHVVDFQSHALALGILVARADHADLVAMAHFRPQ